MNVRSLLSVCAAFSAVFGLITAHAYQLQNQTLEEKARGAEMVVIGRVAFIEREAPMKSYNTAVVRVSKTLKGETLSYIKFGFNERGRGFNPKCCVKGRTYLFFLERSDQDEYFAFNPPHGVYPID